MSFGQAVSSALRRYATFTGRARRSEFWFFYLFFVLVYGAPYLAGTVVLAAGTDPLTGEPTRSAAAVGLLLMGVAVLIGLALTIPTLAATVRRLHDTGRSGFWYFIGFVPFVGGLVLLVMLVQPSQPHPNEHGPDPTAPAPWSPPVPGGAPAAWQPQASYAPPVVDHGYVPGRTIVPGSGRRA
ncbi:DUF805 domain-containing protein [Aquipuribacter sp. SD81]|uniref:DUF805 domain-containing protein n=1 Tax=Aquipuribacter sp. SD81 TaxID=3127703 RepID=UPI00301B1592